MDGVERLRSWSSLNERRLILSKKVWISRGFGGGEEEEFLSCIMMSNAYETALLCVWGGGNNFQTRVVFQKGDF